MKRITLFFFLLTLIPSVFGKWETDPPGEDPAAQQKATVATTKNETGHRLEVYLDENVVLARFSLAHGFDRFKEGTCPTFQVDEKPPVNQSIDKKSCDTDGKQATFTLGYLRDKQIISPVLKHLMRGRNITYRYFLENVGYREITFSLTGSKRVIGKALGPSVKVREKTRDIPTTPPRDEALP
jgi:hypothetical protein